MKNLIFLMVLIQFLFEFNKAEARIIQEGLKLSQIQGRIYVYHFGQNNNPFEYLNRVLYEIKDSTSALIERGYTNQNGEFLFEKLTYNKDYIVSFSKKGFSTRIIYISFSKVPNSIKKDVFVNKDLLEISLKEIIEAKNDKSISDTLVLEYTPVANYHGRITNDGGETWYPTNISKGGMEISGLSEIENSERQTKEIYFRMLAENSAQKLKISNLEKATLEKKNLSLSLSIEEVELEIRRRIKESINQEKIKSDLKERNNFIRIGLIAISIFATVLLRLFHIKNVQKKRSDNLLLNILPFEIAEELKATGISKAKSFESVTVLFTDFKNFTKICEKLSPEDLVKEINYCYCEFDKIITKYHIEKIKTIGDSYMCVGGLPTINETHPCDVVNAGIEIQKFMTTYKTERCNKNELFFELRLGIHSGSVVAGIVGLKKFAYDIWGDTVNIASRMESSGEIGKVNISGSTYELIKDKFQCTYRGKVQVKNKGKIEMYFVEEEK